MLNPVYEIFDQTSEKSQKSSPTFDHIFYLFKIILQIRIEFLRNNKEGDYKKVILRLNVIIDGILYGLDLGYPSIYYFVILWHKKHIFERCLGVFLLII